MRKLYLLLLFTTAYLASYAQITSGEYGGYGLLRLAFDKQTKQVAGNYEFYSGIDIDSGIPRFSCIVYFDGTVINNKSTIKIRTPFTNDSVEGKLTIVNDTAITVSFSKELEDCWNAEYFVKEPVTFELNKPEKWIAAKYISVDKAYFHSAPNSDSKSKAYLVKGDVIFTDSISNGWVHCTYFGEKKNTAGWIKTTNLNN